MRTNVERKPGTVYACSACGALQTRRPAGEEKPLRRWRLPCAGKKCKGRTTLHHPQHRPITGDYR